MANTAIYQATAALKNQKSIFQLIGAITEELFVFIASNMLDNQMKFVKGFYKNPLFYWKAGALVVRIVKICNMYSNHYDQFKDQYILRPVNPLLNQITNL